MQPCARNLSNYGPGSDKVVVTASLNGVLTDPAQFDIPVTPEQMAEAAHESFNAGATVVHVHFRDQRPGKGHLPSWDPEVAKACVDAIRERTPEIIVNLTTGTVGTKGAMGGGDLGPVDGPIKCIETTRPEMAALNSGSLNYLKVKRDGTWAWPPMLFDNPVSKVSTMLQAMNDLDVVPECECFDTGIVRSVRMYEQVGLLKAPIHISLVMGVASGMPAKPEWVPLLRNEMNPDHHFQVIAIGRQEVWDLHRKCIELGGNVRTGLEDTFYLPDGSRATSNGQLIEALVAMCREMGREPATPAEARKMIGVKQQL